MSTIHKALEALARAYGLELEYTDNWGRVHRTDLETARRFLAAKGLVIHGDALDPAPEVLVISEEAPPPRWSFCVPVDPTTVDAPSTPPTVTLRTLDEDGRERVSSYSAEQTSLEADSLPGLPALSVPMPEGLRRGVHKVRADIQIGAKEVHRDATWIVCPERGYVPEELEAGRRIAGVGVALYGVRSRNNWGVGDFSDLRRVIAWAHDVLGVDFVGLNPLHALFNRQPYNISPYLPSSRIFRNFIYLDVRAIEDFKDSPAAKALLHREDTQRLIQGLRDQEQVNYEDVADLKLRILKEVFLTFMENHGRAEKRGQKWADFEAYMSAHGDYLDRFAAFCALEKHFAQAGLPAYTWKEWPAAFRDPSNDEVRDFCAEHKDDVLFWKYVQWQIETELNGVQQYAVDKGMMLGLYHDVALAIDRNGADYWSFGKFFHEGFSVGAPPDAFAPRGQDWGFAPPNRDKIRSAAYEPFIRNLRASCAYGGALRIDHVMQLGRLFWIPAGESPSEGFYVEDYEADLVNILTLESQRNRVLIIGEDLGTVPFAFRERLMANGIFSYRLLYFERDAAGDLLPFHAYPRDALVSISTHDLPTLAGFWSGRDIVDRLRVGHLETASAQAVWDDRRGHKEKMVERLVKDGFLPAQSAEHLLRETAPTDELHSAVLGFLFHTPSRLVMINQEDIFLDIRQQNIPGTTWENPNWVTKMLYTIEELESHPDALRQSGKFRKLLEGSGRPTTSRNRPY